MSDNQLFFLVFIAPWLTALVAGWLVAEIIAQRRVALEMRKVRVAHWRELMRLRLAPARHPLSRQPGAEQ